MLHPTTPDPFVVKALHEFCPVRVIEEPFKVMVSPPSPRETMPFAVRVWPSATVSPAFAEIRPEEVRVPVIEVLSKSEITPEVESITMLPVSPPPMVSVCWLVVWRDPALSSTKSAENEAVWDPLARESPINANLADVVEVPPIKRSMVELIGVRALPSVEVVQYSVPV